ncbi:MAG: hypothetical protein IJ506_07300 [Clostridia bacterium]|nr:hypothetical protein [Clostridia bacterium]
MFGEKEENYGFRKELLRENEPNVCDKNIVAKKEELSLACGVFFTSEESTEIAVAKTDFLEFLSVSCGIEKPFNEDGVEISLSLGGDLKEVNAYKGRRIVVSENKIQIYGFDYRGLACALFDEPMSVWQWLGLLLFMVAIYYKEKISWKNIVGIILCVGALAIINFL